MSGEGAEAMFMGVLKGIVPDPAEVKAWLLPSGGVLCVDQSFTDYVGWGPADVVGKEFASLFVRPSEVEKCVAARSPSLARGRAHTPLTPRAAGLSQLRPALRTPPTPLPPFNPLRPASEPPQPPPPPG